MTTGTLAAPRGPVRARSPRPRGSSMWVPTVLVGVAVLLAAAPVCAVVQGTGWLGYAAVSVAVVAAAGLATGAFGAATVAAAQLGALAITVTALFTEDGVLAVLPGPGALREMGALLAGALEQVRSMPAPVPATPEIAFLVAVAIGTIAVAAHLAAVGVGAPATAAVPMLVAFAVPTAVTDELLPWWALAAGAVAFGLLLVVGANRRRLPGGAAITASGVAVALVVGVLAGAVGTAGRLADAPRGGADIGLDPFTALRGQLTLSEPKQLLKVRGLPRPTYLRALTLGDYVPDTGWEAGRPAPGVALTGPLPAPSGPGERVAVDVENLSYRDYWLPLYGEPVAVSGVDDQLWAYDPTSGTAYTSRPREEGDWVQAASLPVPTADQLRGAGRGGVAPAYLKTSGVDPRVTAIAAQLTAGRPTDFDRTIALLAWFTGPDSPFSYSLATAPTKGDDALVEFLTVGRVGYCEQFASAMAIMLRTQGVPARVAIGYTAGTETEEYRTLSTSDAHAWVEVWFEGVGWTVFDPTPLTDGRTVVPPYVAEAGLQGNPGEAATPQLATPQVAAPPAAAPPAAAPGVAPEPAPAQGQEPAGADGRAEDPRDDVGAGLPPWPPWPLVLVLVLVLAMLVAAPAAWRALERRRRLAVVAAGGPAAGTAAWVELLAESVDRDVLGQRSDTVRGAARRIVREHQLGEDAQASLREVVGAVEASWYGASHPARDSLSAAMADLRAGIETGDPLGWRRRLLPRSIVARVRTALTATARVGARG